MNLTTKEKQLIENYAKKLVESRLLSESAKAFKIKSIDVDHSLTVNSSGKDSSYINITQSDNQGKFHSILVMKSDIGKLISALQKTL